MRYQSGLSRRRIRADDDLHWAWEVPTRVPDVEGDMVGRARPTGVLGPDGRELYREAPSVGFVIRNREQ